MELSISRREGNRKSELKKLRHSGYIPAVIYGKEKNENIFIPCAEFDKALRSMQKGRLATTVFILKDKDKQIKVIVKDIHYDITSYAVIHIDFMPISDDREVKVNVPIECIGKEECNGIKLGGTLRQSIRTLRVKCLPKDMPEFFQIDIKSMEIGDYKRLSDIEMPKNVIPLKVLNEIAVVVAKHQ